MVVLVEKQMIQRSLLLLDLDLLVDAKRPGQPCSSLLLVHQPARTKTRPLVPISRTVHQK